MVQIIERQPTTSDRFFDAIGKGAEGLVNYQMVQQQKEAQEMKLKKENDTYKRLTGEDISGISNPKIREKVFESAFKAKQSEKKQDFLTKLFSGNKSNQNEQIQTNPDQMQRNPEEMQNQPGQGFDVSKISDEDLARANAIDPALGKSLQSSKDTALRENREIEKAKTKKLESERNFHTNYSKKSVDEADALRNSVPKLEMSLDFARNAIESDEVGAFSLANLGERLNIPELQTAKGAQLVTAAKENLLGNMSRVSSKAQNKWFEQRLNSMMAKVGQTKEANLTAQEMLEAEVAMSKAYLNEFERLQDEDDKNYGYERKDISKRAHQAVKPLENHIFKRATYRMKEIEEVEKGLPELKKMVGKNVSKGEPLTLAMAKLYKQKFGDNALSVAEKNGYYIPTLEEFQSYEQKPREFREEL